MSAKARFLEPLLWVVKIDGLLDFEGRGRPPVVLVLGLVDVARREERVEVKAALVGRVG